MDGGLTLTVEQVVVRMGVGYDRLDRQTLSERGITVCNVPDYGTGEIADHALALALTLRRGKLAWRRACWNWRAEFVGYRCADRWPAFFLRGYQGILLHHDLQRGPDPAPWIPQTGPLVRRIQGATFGCLGLGRIGTATALRAKAFGWNVIFFDPGLPNGVDKSLQIERVRTIEELFSRSTMLSIHCPATKHTRRIVSSALLNRLPPGAILVNTARGEVVDTDAVYDALKSGQLAAAGLDVLEVEPVPDPAPKLIQAYRNHEPWLVGRLVVTPHSAFYSPESLDDIRRNSAQTMRDVLLDGLRTNVITPDMD